MPFDFPNSPTLNQTAIAPNGATFVWDGAKWTTTENAVMTPPPGGAPSGPAGGDLSGTYPNPTVSYTATGGSVARTARNRAADVTNVLDYGADPTGAADSGTAFQNALATGRNVWAPAGTYLVRKQLVVAGASQKLYGDGLNTILVIDAGFDATITTGVILLNGATRPAISDLTIQFTQPPDLVKTTTAASAAGTNTITVNSATGIVVGMSLVDRTQRPNAILSPIYNTSQNATTVTNIAGNVITLSANITAPGVSNGDTIQFASVRSMFKTLAAGGTATVGGTGIQYPWAVYAATPGNMSRIDKVMVTNAWNGIYLRQSTFQLGKIDVFAYNVGLDIDQCYNFCAISDYVFYVFGQSVTGGPQDALVNVAYDGQAVAGNLGECDGVGIHNFQTFIGKLNIAASWTWGSFTNLMLDFNASLTISATGGGYVQIANIYSTVNGSAHSLPLHMNPSGAGFRVWIDNFYMTNSSGYPAIQQDNGLLAIDNGYMWYGSGTGQPMIQHNAGGMYLSDLQFDGGGPAPNTNYIALAGSATLSMDDCAFISAPGTNCSGVSATSGNKVAYSNINWNGWLMSVPAAALVRTDYSGINAGSAEFVNGNLQVGTAAGGVVSLALVAAAGNQRALDFYSGASLRWAVIVDSATEGGSNAGSNFSILALSDTGGLLSTPISINRATGVVKAPSLINVSANDGTSMQTGSMSFSGYDATAHYSAAYGFNALGQVQNAGNNNTAFGGYAGWGVTTGVGNVFIGATTGFGNTVTGSSNTVVGTASGYSLTSGGSNVLIGSYVDQGVLTTGSGNILIGNSVGIPAANSSNVINIGNILYVTGTNTPTTSVAQLPGTFILPHLPTTTTYANDAAAATGGVAVGQLYRNGSAVMCRVA